MSKNLNHAAEAADVHQPDVALARRSMLLRSLGKGSAVLAATSLPMHTLASSTTFVTTDGKGCSISGMQSGVNSKNPTTTLCKGKSPGYWHTFSHWTYAQKKQKETTFGVLFKDTTNVYAGYTLFQFVCGIGNGGAVLPPGVKLNDTDEWHWCCAWMNAAARNVASSGVVGFPYTRSQVVDIYNNPTKYNTTRADALLFFKKLEN